MTNKEIIRAVEAFRNARKGWTDILSDTPDSVVAAQHVLSCNTKIEFLKSLWNWSDETIDFPY